MQYVWRASGARGRQRQGTPWARRFGRGPPGGPREDASRRRTGDSLRAAGWPASSGGVPGASAAGGADGRHRCPARIGRSAKRPLPSPRAAAGSADP